MNLYLFNMSDVLHAAQEYLENDVASLACLQLIVSEQLFMMLVLLEKKSDEIIVVFKVLYPLFNVILDILEHFGPSNHVLQDVLPISEYLLC